MVTLMFRCAGGYAVIDEYTTGCIDRMLRDFDARAR